MQNKDQHVYLLQGKFLSSQKELKDLQKTMLMNYYLAKQHNQDHGNSINPQSQASQKRILQKLQTTSKLEKQLKKQFSNHYEEQIARKKLIKRLQKQQSMKEEQQIAKNSGKIIQREAQGIRLARQIQRQQYLNSIKEKQERKRKQKQQEEKEKQYFQRRYSQQNLNKLNDKKNYYEQINQARDQLSSYFTHNKVEQQPKKVQIAKSIQTREKIVDQKVIGSLQNQFAAAQRAKQQFRQILRRQISEKMEMRQRQKIEKKGEKYRSQSYENVHHPIYNPVDLKINHDNQYILKELQEKGRNKISGLAKSGVNILNN